MLQIAIVEDSLVDMEQAKRYLAGYFKERDQKHTWDYQISSYTSGASFLQDFRAGKFDLLVLDVYMPHMTGIDVARKVRETDPNVKIVFLTTSKDHALDGFSVFASGYVLKPLTVHGCEFSAVLDRVLPEEASRAATVTVRMAGQQTLTVPLRKILFMDTRESRGSVLHMGKKNVTTLCPYKDLSAVLLRDDRFLECYHRVVVNMDQIARMEEEDFVLKDGQAVPISRRKKKDVQQAYMQYLLEK